ncbi:hypothetical protein J8I87_09745 [Paraburkholderia sp. LEh10]|jgi:hypothetical protein|uniref:hypothetical protein n=1 Tax=Paraburkholderia sp. LEh10 TaxID=2821353 RepID=UPI001AE64432|nr:hypothetical protein [Paraburkholderia sp. LEh10]MBP0589998.1 hypothetical protein [Paraburkholderia sp. LEh10]
MTKPTWKHALLALAVVSMSLGAACKKADNSTADTGATAGSAPAAATMGASGAAAASGASQ